MEVDTKPGQKGLVWTGREKRGDRVLHGFSGSLSLGSFLKRHRAGANNYGYPVKISKETASVRGDGNGGLGR